MTESSPNAAREAKADVKAAKAKAKAMRPWFQKKRFIIPIAIVVVAAGSSALNGGGENPPTGALSQSESSVEPGESEQENFAETVEEPAADAPSVSEELSESIGEANARQSAEDYLSFMAFSRLGLIDQLLFEGYTQDEAEYGVDALGADWSQQAALSAEAYLELQSFSRGGLIEQLEFEGFTAAEAEYGVTAVGY